MEHDPARRVATPAPLAEVTLIETARSAATDLGDLAARLPGTVPGDATASARVADKLSEEVAELGQMLRVLPARPAPMPGHDYALLMALRTAHAAGEDVGETVARALARLAAELGSSEQVLGNRPGSWEAAAVAGLLSGTVGPDDERLPLFGGPGGSL